MNKELKGVLTVIACILAFLVMMNKVVHMPANVGGDSSVSTY